MKFDILYRRVVCTCVLATGGVIAACKQIAETSSSKSCALIAGLDFAGTVTDPTGRAQRTTMTFTRVSGAPELGRVIFNGSVNGTDTWITDSARTFVANGQTRLVTASNDTLALACAAKKRTLSCENASRSRCLLTEVSH